MKGFPCCAFDNEKLLFHMQLSLPCDVDAIEPVVHRVMHAISETNCVPENHSEVDLALREALANAIIPSCTNDAMKVVQFHVACDESHGMLIVVCDPGSGTDPSTIPPPVQDQNIDSSHGRGIFLSNQLMDETRFNCGGSEIRMHKQYNKCCKAQQIVGRRARSGRVEPLP